MRAVVLVALGVATMSTMGAPCIAQPADPLLCPHTVPHGEEATTPELCDKVYRVQCADEVSSGFLAKLDDQIGLLTTLHGIAACQNAPLRAENVHVKASELRVTRVDVARDLAFLQSKELPSQYLKDHPNYEKELSSGARGDLRIVGYPESLSLQFGFVLRPQDIPLVALNDLIPETDAGTAFRSRNSPEASQIVLSLSGPIQPGFSGAPILNSVGEVVAVADGGLAPGTEIGWAIPYARAKLQPASSLAAAVSRLPSLPVNHSLLTSFATTAVPAVYFVDWRERPGAIHRLQAGQITDVYRRSSDYLYTVAVAPNGDIYFVNANAFQIYRIVGGVERSIYTHTTYVRDVAFGADGRLYFSEATGAGGDGTVYELRNGRAKPWYVVHLADVEGFWAGDFAVDRQGTLWLSSGNRRPSSLFKVVDGKPVRVLGSSDVLEGIAFAKDGSLLYTRGAREIDRIVFPSMTVQRYAELPNVMQLSSVAPLSP